MNQNEPNLGRILEDWLARVSADPLYLVRTRSWRRTIEWRVAGEVFRFAAGPEGIRPEVRSAPDDAADIQLECDAATVREMAAGRLHFFIALWGLGKVRLRGSMGDANRLGFLLGRDARARRIAFVAHCWLNLNTRFPGGGPYPGAQPEVVKALVESGVGIVQMPCPEQRTFGLEKHTFGDLPAEVVRTRFQEVAEGVVADLAEYRGLGFDVVAVIGMDPSPSCGVTMAKGRPAMLGLGDDTSEIPGEGLFIESLRRVAEAARVTLPPVVALRRVLRPEEGEPRGMADLRAVLAKQTPVSQVGPGKGN